MKTDIEENKKKENRGGARPGSGRPAGERTYPIAVRISKQAMEILSKKKNKSEFIDSLIKTSTILHTS